MMRYEPGPVIDRPGPEPWRGFALVRENTGEATATIYVPRNSPGEEPLELSHAVRQGMNNLAASRVSPSTFVTVSRDAAASMSGSQTFRGFASEHPSTAPASVPHTEGLRRIQSTPNDGDLPEPVDVRTPCQSSPCRQPSPCDAEIRSRNLLPDRYGRPG